MLPYRLIVVLAPFIQAARDRITQQFESCNPFFNTRPRFQCFVAFDIGFLL